MSRDDPAETGDPFDADDPERRTGPHDPECGADRDRAVPPRDGTSSECRGAGTVDGVDAGPLLEFAVSAEMPHQRDGGERQADVAHDLQRLASILPIVIIVESTIKHSMHLQGGWSWQCKSKPSQEILPMGEPADSVA